MAKKNKSKKKKLQDTKAISKGKKSAKLKQNKKNTEEVSDKKEKLMRVSNLVRNIICWVLIGALAITVISFIVVKVTGGTPAVFGYTLHRVSSGSMEPELQVGDIIINKNVSDPSEVQKDDIITFRGDEFYDNNHVTHRVIVAPFERDGEYYLQTKGDANDNPDAEIPFSAVESKLVVTAGFLNNFYGFFLSPWGLIIFIVLLLVIFFDELINLIKIFTGNVPDDDEEEERSVDEIIEQIKLEDKKKKKKKRSNKSKKKNKDKKDSKSNKNNGSADKPRNNNKGAKGKKKGKKRK